MTMGPSGHCQGTSQRPASHGDPAVPALWGEQQDHSLLSLSHKVHCPTHSPMPRGFCSPMFLRSAGSQPAMGGWNAVPGPEGGSWTPAGPTTNQPTTGGEASRRQPRRAVKALDLPVLGSSVPHKEHRFPRRGSGPRAGRLPPAFPRPGPAVPREAQRLVSPTAARVEKQALSAPSA